MSSASSVWMSLARPRAINSADRPYAPDAISYTRPQNAAAWLTIQPYAAIKIGSHEIILVQPSTTFFVYILRVLDHIIVAKKGYFSFREAGLIP